MMAPAFAILLQALLPAIQNLLGLAAKHAAAGNHDAAHATLVAATQVGQAAVAVGQQMLPQAAQPAAPEAK